MKASIGQLDKVAQDLFSEWEKEIQEISARELKNKSESKLETTRKRYQQLHSQLKKSERKMGPVLAQFKDQVLYLKHNLNAQAIAGLKTESNRIQADIKSLISEMKLSIDQAEKFIKTM